MEESEIEQGAQQRHSNKDERFYNVDKKGWILSLVKKEMLDFYTRAEAKHINKQLRLASQCLTFLYLC